MYDLYPFQTSAFPSWNRPTPDTNTLHYPFARLYPDLKHSLQPVTPLVPRTPADGHAYSPLMIFRYASDLRTGLYIPLLLHKMPIFRLPSLEIDRADGLHSLFIPFLGLGLPPRHAQVVVLASSDGLGRATVRARAS